MDWWTLIAAWGPAVPILYILHKLLERALLKTIPREIRSLKKAFLRHEREASKQRDKQIKAEQQMIALLRALRRKTRTKKTPK